MSTLEALLGLDPAAPPKHTGRGHTGGGQSTWYLILDDEDHKVDGFRSLLATVRKARSLVRPGSIHIYRGLAYGIIVSGARSHVTIVPVRSNTHW